MTIRELEALIKTIPDNEKDNPCLVPVQSDMPGMFAFEEVCPGATEMIELGPQLECINPDEPKITKALLIAPHSFHEEDEHEKGKEVLN